MRANTHRGAKPAPARGRNLRLRGAGLVAALVLAAPGGPAADQTPIVGWGERGRSWHAAWSASQSVVSIGGRPAVRNGPAPTMDECRDRGACVSLQIACTAGTGGLHASLLIDQHPGEPAPITVTADLPALALRMLTGPTLADTVSPVELSTGPHRWRTEARRRLWDWSFARTPHAIELEPAQARAVLGHALGRTGPVTLTLTPVPGAVHRLAGTATFALAEPASRAALGEMRGLCPGP